MRRFLAVTLLLAAAPASLSAQSALLESCSAITVPTAPPALQSLIASQTQVLCAQVVTTMQSVQPTVGIAFSGANPTLGTASTIGTRFGVFPHVSVDGRVNIAPVNMPNMFNGFDATLTTSQLPALGTSTLALVSLQGDVAVGVFNGLSFGPALEGLGAVDLLGSLSVVPAAKKAGINSTIFNYGGGARVGILKQGILVPGISLTAMYRRMNDVTFGDMTAGDPAEFTTNLSAWSLRGMISKGFMLLDLAAGAGYDIYKSNIDMRWVLNCSASVCGTALSLPPEQITGPLKTAAWNVFADAGISLLVLHVIGEVGYQKPTSVIGPADLQNAGLPNQELVSKDLSGGRIFGSVGLRINF